MKMKLAITLCVILAIGRTVLLDYATYSGNIPSNIYSFPLNAGDTIVGTVSWQFSGDLDLYLYSQGQNLLSGSASIKS